MTLGQHYSPTNRHRDLDIPGVDVPSDCPKLMFATFPRNRVCQAWAVATISRRQ